MRMTDILTSIANNNAFITDNAGNRFHASAAAIDWETDEREYRIYDDNIFEMTDDGFLKTGEPVYHIEYCDDRVFTSVGAIRAYLQREILEQPDCVHDELRHERLTDILDSLLYVDDISLAYKWMRSQYWKEEYRYIADRIAIA